MVTRIRTHGRGPSGRATHGPDAGRHHAVITVGPAARRTADHAAADAAKAAREAAQRLPRPLARLLDRLPRPLASRRATPRSTRRPGTPSAKPGSQPAAPKPTEAAATPGNGKHATPASTADTASTTASTTARTASTTARTARPRRRRPGSHGTTHRSSSGSTVRDRHRRRSCVTPARRGSRPAQHSAARQPGRTSDTSADTRASTSARPRPARSRSTGRRTTRDATTPGRRPAIDTHRRRAAPAPSTKVLPPLADRNNLSLQSPGALAMLAGLALVVLAVMGYVAWTGRRRHG